MSRLFLGAFVAVVTSSWSSAQVPAHLSHVPPDAAVFANVSVAKLWKGPVGEQLRSAKVAELDRVVADFEAVTGLTPADVTSACVYFPDLRKPAPDLQPFVVTLALTKPIDAGRLVAAAAVGCLASQDRVSYRFEKDVLTLRYPTLTPARGGAAIKFHEIALDLTDGLHPRLSVHVAAKSGVVRAVGPLMPALVAAATKDFVVGVNAAMMPPELRGESRRPRADAVPFLPLAKADFALLVGEVAGGKLTVEARFRGGDAAVTRDCETALGAVRTLLSGQLSDGRPKDAKGGPVVAVLDGLRASVEAATTRIDGTDAVATLVVPTDLPFGLALGASAGGAKTEAILRGQTQNNLKHLGLALHTYHDAYGAFPAPAVTDKKGKPLLSWRVAILPQVEAGALYERFKLDEAWDSEHNLKALKDNPMPAVFALPGVTLPGDKETHFRVFVGNGAAFEPLKALRVVDFTDGLSNTLLVVTAAKAVPWTKPDELAFDPKATGGDLKKLLRMDGNGCNVVLADGSARYLPSTIDAATLKGLITRNGGEVLNLD